MGDPDDNVLELSGVVNQHGVVRLSPVPFASCFPLADSFNGYYGCFHLHTLVIGSHLERRAVLPFRADYLGIHVWNASLPAVPVWIRKSL